MFKHGTGDNLGIEDMNIQGEIFKDMVMQEAIKDKEAEMNAMDEEQVQTTTHQRGAEEKHGDQDSDDDFGLDPEEEKIMQSLREARTEQIRSDKAEQRSNVAKGHGDYREI